MPLHDWTTVYAGEFHAFHNVWIGELQPMPLFLSANQYVQVPLEETYRAAWTSMPHQLRRALE